MTKHESEEWKPMFRYEGIYEVSNFGNGRRMARTWGRNRKIGFGSLTKSKSGNGYLRFNLCKDGIEATILIHRAVALVFLDNPFSLPQINHKDGDKKNNHVSNLEWCTPSQNIQHAFDTGLNPGIRGEKQGRSILKSKDVTEIRKSGLSNTELAKKFKVDQSTISKLKSNVSWRHI